MINSVRAESVSIVEFKNRPLGAPIFSLPIKDRGQFGDVRF